MKNAENLDAKELLEGPLRMSRLLSIFFKALFMYTLTKTAPNCLRFCLLGWENPCCSKAILLEGCVLIVQFIIIIQAFP
jgi:hypothetical protein